MIRTYLIILLLSATCINAFSERVKVRIFSSLTPKSAIFSVVEGKYELDLFTGDKFVLAKGEPVSIFDINGKLAVNLRNRKGLMCDSLLFTALGNNDFFSLRVNGNIPVRQNYSGDLKCIADMKTMVFVNVCDVENYISGVVSAEGGNGKYLEYFKTQAVIARTYMYKYLNKHISDGFNLCDGTHCQVFNGLSTDSVIKRATSETAGLVIIDPDSALILSAFHSNCGGETSSSENVWLVGQSYLRSVVDTFCLSSHNARWTKKLSINQWSDAIKKSGLKINISDYSKYNYNQPTRAERYTIDTFAIPLTVLRNSLNLRSTFFSVVVEGDSVILQGRGYGHGVGLCQEGAMKMAELGFDYNKIIRYYYSGVTITDIRKVAFLSNNSILLSP
jgi:stage II sporulation protein D